MSLRLFSHGVDAFAQALSFLSAAEIVQLRLVSKALCRVADGDVVWARWVQEQLCFTLLVPLPLSSNPTPKSRPSRYHGNALSGGSWKQFVQRLQLHRFSRAQPSAIAAAPVAPQSWITADLIQTADTGASSTPSSIAQNNLHRLGRWVTVASAGDVAGEAHFHASATAVVDALHPPQPFSVTQHTATVGIVLAGPYPGDPSSTKMLHAMQQQVLDFLQVSTTRIENLVCDLQAPPQRAPAPMLRPSATDNADETPTSPPCASIDFFSATPQARGDAMHHHRAVLLLRTTPDARRNPLAVGKLLETMFQVCSSVQFLSANAEEAVAFCNWFGAAFPTVSAAPFSTGENTPSVVFTTVQSPMMDVNQLIRDGNPSFGSWVLNRSSSVGVGLLEHNTLCSLAKPLRCPPWVNPSVTASIAPSTVLRMLKAYLDTRCAWSVDVMKYHCTAEEQRVRNFYEHAIQTEFEHHTRCDVASACPALHTIAVPMDPLLMVEAHNLYFYAALRKFGYGLHSVCGRDSDGCMKLLEVLKRNISDAFRTFWRRNNEYSRFQCHAVFDHAFGPVGAKFYDIEHSPLLHHKRGLRQWYTTMGDKIHEYELKAKGLRKFDILSEELSGRVFPQMIAFVEQNEGAGAFCTRLEDAKSAIADLRQLVIERTAVYNKTTDGALNKAQHETALYTAAMSNELASLLSKTAAATLQALEEDSEAWEQACLHRIRVLTATKKRVNDRQVIGGSSVQDSESLTETQKHLTSDGGSSLALDDTFDDLRSPSAMDDFHVTDNDADILYHDTLLSRCAEGRDHVISEALAAESDSRAQATRLTARMQSRNSEFDVVVREHDPSASTTFSRFRNAIRKILR